MNGRVSPALSDPETLGGGARLLSLGAALTGEPDLVSSHLGRHTEIAAHPFNALNTALFSDGAVLHVPDGVTLEQIVQELTDRSRAPLPQNVHYTLEDWADSAGLLTLADERTLNARSPEVLERFVGQTKLSAFVSARRGPNEVQLLDGVNPERLREVARDHGFLVQQAESPE